MPNQIDELIRQYLMERLTAPQPTPGAGLPQQYQALLDVLMEQQERQAQDLMRQTAGQLSARGLYESPISEVPMGRIREQQQRLGAKTAAELGIMALEKGQQTQQQAIGQALTYQQLLQQGEQQRLQQEMWLAQQQQQAQPRFGGDLGWLAEGLYQTGQALAPIAGAIAPFLPGIGMPIAGALGLWGGQPKQQAPAGYNVAFQNWMGGQPNLSGYYNALNQYTQAGQRPGPFLPGTRPRTPEYNRMMKTASVRG